MPNFSTHSCHLLQALGKNMIRHLHKIFYILSRLQNFYFYLVTNFSTKCNIPMNFHHIVFIINFCFYNNNSLQLLYFYFFISPVSYQQNIHFLFENCFYYINIKNFLIVFIVYTGKIYIFYIRNLRFKITF